MNDASLARLIKDGRIFLAPYGAPAPTGPTWTPSAAYRDLGYYSEDGFTLSPQPGDNTQLKGHNGDIVVDESDPGNWTLAFSGIEEGKDITETYFDTTVDPEDGSFTVTKASVETYRSVVTIGIGSNGETILLHYPRVKVSDREDITFNRTTLEALGVTFSTYKDTSPDSPYQFKGWSTALQEKAAVTGASPSGAEATTGTTIEITGTGLRGVTAVKFASAEAEDFTVVSSSKILAVLPTGTAGTAGIKVLKDTVESTSYAFTRGA